MYRLIFLLVTLFSVTSSRSQTFSNNPAQNVWDSFHKLVHLPAEEQLEGFKILQDKCIQLKLTSDSTYTNLLFLLAGAEFINGNVNEAIALLEEDIKISLKFPEGTPIEYLSKYYFYLGYYQAQNGFFDLAVRHYNKAYELGIQTNNRWGIPAIACYTLSNLYFDIQDYNIGSKYAMLGVDIAKRNNENISLFKCLYSLCINLNELGLVEEVANKIDSLDFLSDLFATDQEKSIYYKFVGNYHFDKKQYKIAKKWFLKSLRIAKKLNDHSSIEEIFTDLQHLTLIADEKLENQRYTSLAQRYNKSPYDRSRFYSNLALADKKLLEYDKALYNLQRSLLVLPINFAPKSIAENPTAKQFKNLSIKDYLVTLLLNKAEILSLDKNNKTNLKDALNTYLLLDTLVDYIRWQHQGVASKLFWREKINDLYEQALATCYLLNDIERAFYFLEKSRAVLLLDQLNSNAAQIFLPNAEAEREAALRMRVNHYQSNEEQNEQLSDFLQAQAKLDEYVKNLEQRYPRYYEYKYNNHVPDLASVQEYLTKNQQTLLTYYEGKNDIYLLVATPKKSLLKKIDAATYYKGQQELKSFFNNKNKLNQQYHKYLQVSSHFYQIFLAPIKPYLTHRIIVSTNGAILPFAALSSSAQRADYLIHHHAFSYTYSARSLLNIPVNPTFNKESSYFLGIAPVHFPYKTSLASLSASEKAIETNCKLFHSSHLLTNEEAKRSHFEARWPQATIVQLISHAYADQESDQPVIYFSDSSLSLNNIHQQQVKTQLLMLSACRTSIGKDYKGEGVFSLSRGFMATGVPSIYSTLWDINDQDAYTLSYQVLKAVSKQIPLDLALQKAQLDWLSKPDRGRQLPNAWASIILLGSTIPLPAEPFSYTWIYYVLAVCLLLTIGIRWYKHRKTNLTK